MDENELKKFQESVSEVLADCREKAQGWRNICFTLFEMVDAQGEEKTIQQASIVWPVLKDRRFFKRCLDLGARKATAMDGEFIGLLSDYLSTMRSAPPPAPPEP